VGALAAAFAVALVSWVSVRRLVAAHERRAMVRREAAVSIIQIGALAILACGPVALTIAWWLGFEPRWSDSLASLAPALAGGWAATLGGVGVPRMGEPLARMGERARRGAQTAFHGFVRFERRVVAILARIWLTLIAPARDLHTGDAQEYLLFVVGIAVLTLVLPLLR
jgi:hypothetical protein